MGRAPRAVGTDEVHHALNRGNARLPLFESPDDYDRFAALLEQAVERTSTRLLAWCLMPNHWHLLIWPRHGAELSDFVGWLTLTHTQRWHAARGTAGSGHLYQGRFKSFAVQDDAHLLTVWRYIERNPLRAGLVERAEDWAWSSLAQRQRWLDPGPLPRPDDWLAWVNSAETDDELAALRQSVTRGRPFGDSDWVDSKVVADGLEATVRGRGRPRKDEKGS